ncbi:unnamed protein product, partial [Amoebophrya sp. A120]
VPTISFSSSEHQSEIDGSSRREVHVDQHQQQPPDEAEASRRSSSDQHLYNIKASHDLRPRQSTSS